VRITFKAFATLGDHLPPSGGGYRRSGNEIALELPEGACVQAVIEQFNMPPALVHLVLVNGRYIPPAERMGQVLADGDALAIWPPIAGG
jgi:molybdopterin converting factor small subunit